MNASIIEIESEINRIYGTLVTFFKQTKSDIIQLENRVERLEKNVKLLNWQNSIEYQMWNGIEYADLDDVAKIICLTRDFYDITKGSWTTSDLLLLKTAMSTIGISPRTEISYNFFIKSVSQNYDLMKKLFDGINIEKIEQYPEYIALTAGIKKNLLLDTDEKYLVDNTVEVLAKRSYDVSESEIKDDLLEIYEREGAQMNLKTNVYAYDLVLEMLYNLEQIKEIQYARTLDDKLKEAEMLFSIYDTEKLIPLLKELIDYGYTKAKYMMALLYETGCVDLKRDDDKCDELLNECIEDGYLPAKVRKYLPLERLSAPRGECIRDISPILSELKRLAENGDSFANEECARIYINAQFFEIDCPEKEGYVQAIDYFKRAPLVLGYYGIAKRYDNGNGVEKDYKVALELYLKSANMGYSKAEYEVGRDYAEGYGTEKNANLAFQYYKKAYEHGNLKVINEYARCYSNAIGVEQDDNKAFELFSEGADKGVLNCICNLGWCYHNGRGVEKDMTKAKEYYQIASEQGDEWAKERLKTYF
ncbi:MAG: tetratricopeptide repeat protein [Clostridium sp.]|nr:tetratricopeptide repeat protein [Clostridium sp.]